jgi:general stress protein 26
MAPEARTYLETQRVGVIAVEMPDGSPHAATVHFAHTADPLQFIFLTGRGYRKAEPLLSGPNIRASFVVGATEENKKTLQLDGIASLTSDDDLIDAYYAKFADKDRAKLTQEDIFFVFRPTWWRFTDYTTPGGKTVYSSKNQ